VENSRNKPFGWMDEYERQQREEEEKKDREIRQKQKEDKEAFLKKIDRIKKLNFMNGSFK